MPQLTAVVQLARLGSFGDAAAASGVSQPAFSRTIQMIETRLGARLFDRDTHRTSLTPAGEKLLPMALDLLDRYGSCFEEFDDFIHGRSGTIRIAVLPSVAANLLPETLKRFGAAHPEVRFELWEDVGEPVHRAVRDAQADFGIAPPPGGEDLAFQNLLDDELVLIMPQDDLLADAGEQDWRVFSSRPYVALSSETGLRTLVDEALLCAGVEARPSFVCKQPTSVAAFVSAGLGLGVLSRLTYAQLGTDAVRCVPLRGPSKSRPIGIVTHQRRTLPPITRKFIRELTLTAQRFQIAASQQAVRS
jgi:DNA-binding transcriptional LysR family regulator